MMYEPPNRGGKTYQTLNNTPTGTNDPAALTDPAVLDDSFLWTRGYTTGVDRLGKQSRGADGSYGHGLAFLSRMVPKTRRSPALDMSTS